MKPFKDGAVKLYSCKGSKWARQAVSLPQPCIMMVPWEFSQSWQHWWSLCSRFPRAPMLYRTSASEIICPCGKSAESFIQDLVLARPLWAFSHNVLAYSLTSYDSLNSCLGKNYNLWQNFNRCVVVVQNFLLLRNYVRNYRQYGLHMV